MHSGQDDLLGLSTQHPPPPPPQQMQQMQHWNYNHFSHNANLSQPPPPPPQANSHHSHQQEQEHHTQNQMHGGQAHSLTLPPLVQIREAGEREMAQQHKRTKQDSNETGRMGQHQQSLQTLADVAAVGKRKARRGIDIKSDSQGNVHARKAGRFANVYGISQHSLTDQMIRPLMRFCQDTAAEYLKVSTNTLSKACARLSIKWPRRPEVPTTVRDNIHVLLVGDELGRELPRASATED